MQHRQRAAEFIQRAVLDRAAVEGHAGARAFRYQKLLDEGQYASISEMAAAERIDRGYLGTLLRLTLLAPELVEAFLDGRQAPTVGLPALLDTFPPEWSAQRATLVQG